MSNGQWKLVPVEPTKEMMREMVDPFVAINGDNRSAFFAAYPRMLAAAPDAPSAEPVAWMNARNGFICKEKARDYHTPLYAIPPDAAAEITRLRAEVERLQTSWNAQCKSADKLFELNAQQAERIAELESSLEIEKGQCELREEENRILFTRMEAQSAALATAREALETCKTWQEIREYAPSIWHRTHDQNAVESALIAIAELEALKGNE